MVLLLFSSTAEDEIDQVLMVVPDGFDHEQALDEASDAIPSPVLEAEVPLDEDRAAVLAAFSQFRAYIG